LKNVLIADISRLEFRSAVMKRVIIKEIKLKTAQNMVEMLNNPSDRSRSYRSSFQCFLHFKSTVFFFLT